MISRKLEYLIALAREKQFARAAAACNVSQPALSSGIQQLEQELGVPIVRRGQRFRGLTPQGEIVLQWAQRMENDCLRLHQELRDSTDQLEGTLRLAVLNSTTPFTSIFTVPFTQRFPDVNLQVRMSGPFEIQQGIEEGAFDAAISYLSPNVALSHVLYRQEYYLMTRKRSRWSALKKITWEDVRQIPLCVYPAETQVYGTEAAGALATPHPGIARVETNAMMVLLDHVRTGAWATILPKPVLFMVAGSNEFEVTPLPHGTENDPIGIFVPTRKPESKLARTFFQIATSRDILRRFHEFNDPAPFLKSERKTRKVVNLARS